MKDILPTKVLHVLVLFLFVSNTALALPVLDIGGSLNYDAGSGQLSSSGIVNNFSGITSVTPDISTADDPNITRYAFSATFLSSLISGQNIVGQFGSDPASDPDLVVFDNEIGTLLSGNIVDMTLSGVLGFGFGLLEATIDVVAGSISEFLTPGESSVFSLAFIIDPAVFSADTFQNDITSASINGQIRHAAAVDVTAPGSLAVLLLALGLALGRRAAAVNETR